MKKHLFLWLFAIMTSMPLFVKAESRISVTDQSIADWDNLPAAYVQQAVCPDDAALIGMTSMKVYADEQYIFLLVEPNMEELPDLEWVPFHIFIDTDNSDATGGYGDMFTDANTDIMLEGSFWWDGEIIRYAPAVFKWWGEVGGDGWDYWTNPAVEHDGSDCWGALVCEGELYGCTSQYVNGKFEIQILRAIIPVTWNSSKFGIGVEIQQNWSSVGILPTASPTDANPWGKAKKLTVTIEKEQPQAPSDAVLADYYDQGNVCVCIYVPEELACNNIVLTGTYNGWSSNVAQCAAFEAVEGYDGWYVASFAPEAQPDAEKGIQVKPVILDKNGGFNWEYQIGAATPIRGGVQVVPGAYSGEIDLVGYGTDAPNVLSVDGWKQDPCAAVYHNYTITVISDGCDGLAVPFLIGAMNNWQFEQMTLDQEKTMTNQVPTYSISFETAEGTPYQILSGTLDPETGEIDEMPTWNDQCYLQEKVEGVWARIAGEDGDNFLTHENENIVYDLRSNDLHWARCDETPLEYIVLGIKFPTANRPEAVEIIGNFDDWQGTAMEKLDNGWYFVELEAKASQYFKFRPAGSWDQELEIYNAEDNMWSVIAENQFIFGQLWQDDIYKGTPCKSIELDFSDPAYYRWTGFAGHLLTIKQAQGGCVQLELDETASYTFHVVPTENWQIHTVSLNSYDITDWVLDNNGTIELSNLTQDTELNITFVEVVGTGIDNASANSTKVYGDKERVIVTNAPANDMITVYSQNGSVVKRVQANSDRTVINLPRGLYIVRVNNMSVKVML